MLINSLRTELVLPEVDFNASDTLTTPSASQSAENPVAPMDPSPVSNAEDPIGECPLEHGMFQYNDYAYPKVLTLFLQPQQLLKPSPGNLGDAQHNPDWAPDNPT